MALFKKNFIISLILALIFFLNQPLQAITEPDGPRVKTKKTWQKGTKGKKLIRISQKKKKLKKISQKQKKKRSASVKKRRKTVSTRRSIARVYRKRPVFEEPIRPSVSTAGSSLQNLVENEILYLKELRHLLPGDQISLQVYDLNDKKCWRTLMEILFVMRPV